MQRLARLRWLLLTPLCLLLLLSVSPLPNPAAAAPTALNLPAGFVSETVLTGLPYPTTIAFAPNGRMFIGQKDGRVRIAVPSGNGYTLRSALFIDLRAQVNNYWDRGLLGIALHPDFPTTPYVYLLYTYDPPELPGTGQYDEPDGEGERVARLMRVEADQAQNYNVAKPGTEVILLGTNSTFANIGDPNARHGTYPGGTPAPPSCDDNGTPIQDCLAADSQTHTIGTLAFGLDGALYVSNGEGASPNYADTRALRALNLESLGGKILRIDPITGSGYADNPFCNGGDLASNRCKVWSYGLRNPFRFTLHPTTNEPFIGDVGWSTWEELNRGQGKNFGWPCYEGGDTVNLQQPSYQFDPSTAPTCEALYDQVAAGQAQVQAAVYAYNHDSGDSSIQAGDFYEGTDYPAQYRNALYIEDYNGDWIKYVTFDGSGNATVHDFADDVSITGGPVQLIAGPDTNLYYVVFNGTNNSEIRRIRYTGQPVAIAEASPTNGPLPLAVNFSGDDSFDPAGQPLTYQWAFGDGATSNSANPAHTYTLTGTYTAVLTVTDTTSTTATDSVDIFAGNAAPIATIITPTTGTTYDVDDVINFSGTGIDAEDGTLPGTSLQWEVKLHHHQHVHFDYHNATGLSGSFTAPDHGNDTAMEICLTVTDSGNLSDTECLDLLPNTVVYTFNTNPSGFQIVYEGASYTTPFTATPIVNSYQTIIAPLVQQHRSFSSWSDGGSSSHAITIAASPQTYLATYVNLAPTAVIGATPISGPAPLIVTLSGAGSSDSEEDILTYLWNFGDGGTSTLTNPLHTYAFTGTYTAILTVTDELGLTGSSSRTINVGTKALYLPIIVK